MEGWMRRPSGHWWCRDRRRHACQSRQAGTGCLTLGLHNFWRLSQGGTEFLLWIKFLQEKAEDDWVLKDKFDPVWAERKKGRGGVGGGGVEVARNTSPGGIDWNWQCVLSERLPIHRSFLRPLPYQGSSVKGAAAKPCERSSSSIPEAPSSSPRPIAWPKKCGPGASRPRPITASSAGAAKRTGRLKRWDRNLFPVWSSETRSAQCPAPLCKPSSTGSRDGESRVSAVAIRGSRPSSPEKCHTTGSAGMLTITKRSR